VLYTVSNSQDEITKKINKARDIKQIYIQCSLKGVPVITYRETTKLARSDARISFRFILFIYLLYTCCWHSTNFVFYSQNQEHLTFLLKNVEKILSDVSKPLVVYIF